MFLTKNTSFNYYLKPKEDRELATEWSSRLYAKIKHEKGDFWMDMKVWLSCIFLKNMKEVIKENLK